MKYFLLIILLMASFSATGQKIYKWVDADGVVHYSQDASAQADEFKVSTHEPPPAVADQTTDGDDAASSKETSPAVAIQPAAPSRREIRERKKYLCENGRKQVEIIEPRTRVSEVAADGQVRQLTNEERLERLAKAKQQVEENC